VVLKKPHFDTNLYSFGFLIMTSYMNEPLPHF
jgi:hypothetical protein